MERPFTASFGRNNGRLQLLQQRLFWLLARHQQSIQENCGGGSWGDTAVNPRTIILDIRSEAILLGTQSFTEKHRDTQRKAREQLETLYKIPRSLASIIKYYWQIQ